MIVRTRKTWVCKSRVFLLASYLAVLIYCAWRSDAPAAEYPRQGSIIGRQLFHVIRDDDSLLEIARSHDLGFNDITLANPGVDPFLPDRQRKIVIPSEWILPDVPIRPGIVINRAEMRLYLFASDKALSVTSFPIGVGDFGKDTPLGNFTIIEKIKDPAWHVPRSIRMEKPYLPPMVPPGAANPLGSHALRLSIRTILIHGTNRPWGIGTRNTHGCIRLYPEDIVQLFGMVPLGTPVKIVDQPVKTAVHEEGVYLEVHNYEDNRDLYRLALDVLAAKNLTNKVDPDKVRKAAQKRSGLLVDVSGRQPLVFGMSKAEVQN